jgi:hypothetical protein
MATFTQNRRGRGRLVVFACGLLGLACGLWLLSRTRPNTEPAVVAATPAEADRPPVRVADDRSPPRPVHVAAPAPKAKRNYLALYNGLSGVLPPELAASRRAGVDLVAEGGGARVRVHADKALVVAGQKVKFEGVLETDSPRDDLAVTVQVSRRLDEKPNITLAMQPAPGLGEHALVAVLRSDDPALSVAGGNAAPPLDLELSVSVTSRLDHKEIAHSRAEPITISRSGARLREGEAELRRNGENLELDVAFDIKTPGRFWAYAELWGQDKPLAFGRRTLGELPAGRSHTTLTFGGAIIRDLGVDGPYVVKNVTLARVDTKPPHLAQKIERLDPSPRWAAAEFGHERED